LLGKRQITTIVASSSAKGHFEYIEVDMVVSKNNAIFKAKHEREKHVSRSEWVGGWVGGTGRERKKGLLAAFLHCAQSQRCE
jgi:hypothetical protein